MPPSQREKLRDTTEQVLSALDKYETEQQAPAERAGVIGRISKAILGEGSVLGGLADRRTRREYERRIDRLEKAIRKQDRAAAQGTAINAALDVYDLYGGSNGEGVSDPTGATFRALRSIAAYNEVVLAIVGRRVDQVAVACRVAKKQGNRVQQMGYSVALSDEKAKPTKDDEARMREIEQFLLTCGSAKPPDTEAPEGWQPSFEMWVRATMKDRLELDWISTRFWYSEHDPDRLTCFAPFDAGRVRNVPGTITKVEDGHRVRVPYKKKRATTDEDIKYVAVDSASGTAGVVDEFTEREMACAYANPRTDVAARGYGYSELEQALTAAAIFMSARTYNASRFRLDALPRGILTLMGNFDAEQLTQFKSRWREMFQGVTRRWGFPVFTASTKDAAANWLALDQSSRDMEYHQFMFTVSLWLHALYKIHPEETGFEALSPFRPPLSEASPEAKLQSSQDGGLIPLFTWLEDYINREIVKRLDPSGRYKFRWEGIGQRSPLEDAQVVQAQLASGQITPGEVLDAMDKKRAKWLRDCPAYDLHMPLPQGFQTMLQLYQTAMMISQQQQAQAMQAQAASQSRVAGDMQGMMPPQGAGGADTGAGMPPGAGGAPPQGAGGGGAPWGGQSGQPQAMPDMGGAPDAPPMPPEQMMKAIRLLVRL